MPDANDLIDNPEIDLVAVAVTLPAHRELIMAALVAGKHIYCEYQLGYDVAESRELADAARLASVHTAIGLQTQLNPAALKARELIAASRIGRPLSARVYSSTVGFGAKTPPAEAYTENPDNGVTLVTIQGAHTLDLVTALLGEFTDMSALMTRQYPEIRIGNGELQARTTFDHLLVQARLAGGVAVLVEVAGGRPPATPFTMEVVGDLGTLALTGGAPRGFQSGRLRLALNGQPQSVDEGEISVMNDQAANVAAVYAALRDDVANGTRTVPGFDHAVRVAQLIDEATISFETGKRMTPENWLGKA